MDKNRPGFITTSGILAGFVTVLVVIVVGFVQGGVLYSPGQLNAKSGAALGGVTSHAGLGNRCSACHAAFWQSETMAGRCVACHTEVAAQQKDPGSLHGILYQDDPTAACRSCHPDHRGPSALLTDMQGANFPHTKLGYSLAAHPKLSTGAPFTCKDCHVNGYGKFDQTVCVTCHTQIKADFMQSHLLAYGNNCVGCHDGIDTYGHAFNHQKVSFQLTGKHAQVTCDKCHQNDHTIADMKGTSTGCVSCHEKNNPHSSSLGSDCAACHTAAGWSPATVDHDLTAFPLTGKHAAIACTDCHQNNIFNGTPTQCMGCHAKDDPHSARLSTDCASCHTTTGWTPATIDHNLTAFPLTGKHIQVDCTACHINNVFQGTPTTCYACHKKDDTHKGAFGTDCGLCHKTDGWLPAFFNHSGFPLNNGHAGLACSRCHSSGVYAGLSTFCASCHQAPVSHVGLFNSNCASCHTTVNWNFNHPGGCGEGGCLNHHGATCQDCHANGYTSHTCTKCHSSNNPTGD